MHPGVDVDLDVILGMSTVDNLNRHTLASTADAVDVRIFRVQLLLYCSVFEVILKETGFNQFDTSITEMLFST